MTDNDKWYNRFDSSIHATHGNTKESQVLIIYSTGKDIVDIKNEKDLVENAENIIWHFREYKTSELEKMIEEITDNADERIKPTNLGKNNNALTV